MSDSEDFVYVKKLKTVHYGSIEESEKARLRSGGGDNDKASDEFLSKGIATGNINVSDEYMDLEAEVSKDKQLLLEEFERRKKVRQIMVSTDDDEVKLSLRQLDEPICIFGEGPADRRNRLKDLLARLGEDGLGGRKKEEEQEKIKEEQKQQETTWYHEGPESLKIARQWIADFSLKRAHKRLQDERESKDVSEAVLTAKKQELQKKMNSLSIMSSQIGDNRPISFCKFSPNSSMLATTSWSGMCHLWSVPNCERIRVLRGHTCNVSCITWHPEATKSVTEESCCLVSCATDGSVKLWNLVDDSPIADLEGHAPFRVSRVEFHPSGRFLGSCCFDNSWRLWDLEVEQEILHQEGHNKPVYCISFQIDGSLVVTGSMDSFARVWDLRTGQCIWFMNGHFKPILAVDFSPNGYQIATGSEDNSCLIWDLRKCASVYNIPCHTNLVSGVKFQPGAGKYLATSSYDNTVKVWSTSTWQPLKTLAGHDSKVMSVDISPDNQFIASSSFDRTFKLWSPE